MAAALAAAASFTVYQKRNALVSSALRSAVAPLGLELEIGELDFDVHGSVTATGLTVTDAATGEQVASVPEVRGQFRWRQLPRREIDSLVVSEPTLTVDSRLVDRLAGRSDPGQPHPGSRDGDDTTRESTAFKVGELAVRDATFSANLDGFPAIAGTVNYHGEDLTFGGPGGPGSGRQELEVRDVTVTGVGSDGTDADPIARFPRAVAVVTRLAPGAALEVESVGLDRPEFELTPASLALLRGEGKVAGTRAGSPRPPQGQPQASPAFAGARVASSRVTDATVRVSGFDHSGLDDGTLTFNYEGGPTTVTASGELDTGPQSLAVALDFGGSAQVPSAGVEFQFSTSRGLEVDRVEIPSGRLALAALDPLRPPTAAPAPAPERAPGGNPTAPARAGTQPTTTPPGAAPFPALPFPVTVADARIDLGLDAAGTGPLESGGGHVALRATDLALDSGHLRSAAEQSFTLTNASASAPGLGFAASLGTFSVSAVPDNFSSDRRLASVTIEGLELDLDPALAQTPAPRPSGGGSEDGQPNPPTALPARAGTPFWHGIDADQISVQSSTFRLAGSGPGGRPEVHATLSVGSTPVPGGAPLHTLTLGNVQATVPGELALPLFHAREIAVATTAAEAWEHSAIRNVTVTGARLTANEQLAALVAPDHGDDAPARDPGAAGEPDPTQQEAQPAGTGQAGDDRDPNPDTTATGSTSPWSIGTLAVHESAVTLEGVVPGLPPVSFGVETELHAVPLSAAALAASDERQTVEIAEASLRSRINPLIQVAELDSVFVTFSLAGLLRQHIDEVHVVNPTIYVGEHLFWYIDFFRKHEEPRTATADVDANVDAEATGGAENSGAAGWDIGLIETQTGKIVFAPKGVPIPTIPPVPFAGETRLQGGRLTFVLDDGRAEDISHPGGNHPLVSLSIPEGDYPLRALDLDFDIDLIGLSGHVAFNLPIGQETNNLVETLHAKRVRFERFSLDDVYLAVTYNQSGVYATFGGHAHDGYLNGALNVYIADGFPWDGWLAGSSVDLASVSGALTPTYLHMTGTADCKLVAQGDLKAIENLIAKGSFSAREGGEVNAVALGDLAESLPDSMEPLKRTLTETGLEILQHFTYDTADIACQVAGREGRFDLDLKGPSGSRSVEVVAHDHRYRTPDGLPAR